MTLIVKIKQLPHAEGLSLPFYATDGSAGMDLCAAISNTLTLYPGQRMLIPTGLQIELPENYEMQIRPRSGLSFKHSITVCNSPATIDSDYRGEIGVLLINLGCSKFVIDYGMRIAQAVVAPVTKVIWDNVSPLSRTGRGEGGFGSTGV